MQGRLSPSPEGKLAFFPMDCWEDEFRIARDVGLNHIEIYGEEEFNSDNPLWSTAGRKRYLDLKKESGTKTISACDFFIIKHSLLDKATLKKSIQFIECVSEIGVSKIVLPLFEESEPALDNFKETIKPVRALADISAEHSISLCCETSLPGVALKNFLDALDHKNVGVCYDVGNCSYFKHDILNDIRKLGSRIQHVHLKDKNDQGVNVLLGTGIVDFKLVFDALNDIQFNGIFTMETSRGTDPAKTARKNLQYIKTYL